MDEQQQIFLGKTIVALIIVTTILVTTTIALFINQLKLEHEIRLNQESICQDNDARLIRSDETRLTCTTPFNETFTISRTGKKIEYKYPNINSITIP